MFLAGSPLPLGPTPLDGPPGAGTPWVVVPPSLLERWPRPDLVLLPPWRVVRLDWPRPSTGAPPPGGPAPPIPLSLTRPRPGLLAPLAVVVPPGRVVVVSSAREPAALPLPGVFLCSVGANMTCGCRIPVPATISSWGRAPVRLGIFRSEDFSSRLICSRSASHLIRPKSDLTPFCSHPVLSSVFSPPLSYCFSLVLCTSRKTQKTCSLSQGLNLIARGVGMLKAPSLPLSPET